jgi:hypothetical protein
MGYFEKLGPLSYIGIALILFFIISFFIKKENVLTRPQTVQYQSLKLEVTLNILVFLAGLVFLFIEYNNNYQVLNTRYSGETRRLADSLREVRGSFQTYINETSKKEKITFEFLIRLDTFGGSFPEPSELQCSYKETESAPLKKAVVDNNDYGGSEGTYKVVIYDIERFSTIPYIKVDYKNTHSWVSEENVYIRPPLVELKLNAKP